MGRQRKGLSAVVNGLSECQKGIKLLKANIILIDCANSIGFGQLLNVNIKDSQ